MIDTVTKPSGRPKTKPFCIKCFAINISTIFIVPVVTMGFQCVNKEKTIMSQPYKIYKNFNIIIFSVIEQCFENKVKIMCTKSYYYEIKTNIMRIN